MSGHRITMPMQGRYDGLCADLVGVLERILADMSKPTPKPEPVKVRPAKAAATCDEACGTRRGYRRHQARSEQPCAPCTKAAAVYEQERQADLLHGRPRMVDATGAARRIRALCRMGWPHAEIAARAGFHEGSAHRWVTGRRKSIARDANDRLAALYEELCMTAGPSDHVRMLAERSRWAPPLAWDNIDDPDERPSVPTTRLAKVADVTVDEVAVLRAARGERLRLTANERAATVGKLAREGMSDRLIAERMGLTPRSVLRIRTKDGVAAVHDPAGNRVTA